MTLRLYDFTDFTDFMTLRLYDFTDFTDFTDFMTLQTSNIQYVQKAIEWSAHSAGQVPVWIHLLLQNTI